MSPDRPPANVAASVRARLQNPGASGMSVTLARVMGPRASAEWRRLFPDAPWKLLGMDDQMEARWHRW